VHIRRASLLKYVGNVHKLERGLNYVENYEPIELQQ